MILKQYYLGCLSHASYLVADETTRVAIVVDPQRDIDAYLADAQALGVEIRHVFLTHFHADFVSGHLELREKVGAVIHLGARARADYAFTPAKDGDVLEFGDLRLNILETPGHTPESISIVVYDLAHDPQTPHAVLTGDTLFIGDVGRPDLMASAGASASELASELYDSLHEKLLGLPDSTLVYPAHGAGSMCGKNLSQERSSTLGAQRQHNDALQPMSKLEFVRMTTSDLPQAPRYFAYDAQFNQRERATLDQSLALSDRALDLDAFLEAIRRGAVALDAREPVEFEAAHLGGSINIGLGGKYATWAGTLIDRELPIALIAAPGRESEAALRLGRIGFDRVIGHLRGGIAALAGRRELVRSTARISPQDLARERSAQAPPHVLDVRSASEWREQHLEQSQSIPLPELEERIREVPRDRRIAVHCQSGYRSAIAASLLEKHGITDLVDVAGGIAAWQAAGLKTISERPVRTS